jgi:CHAT domain-containing protein
LCAPPSASGEEQKAILSAGEISQMRLNARLSVLSACHTGEGQVQGGEGLLGLAWAFRAAGVPSLVVSHWSVDDATTKQLMVRFYQELKSGKPKDEALQTAMLSVT